MSQARSEGDHIGAYRTNISGRSAADRLALAASPTFAIMGLLTAALGNRPAEILCAAAHPSPLGGMVIMYLLMTVFHAGPWVRLIFGRVGSEQR